MGVSKGASFLLQIGDGVTPTEGFATIAGLRDTDLTLNGGTIDITTKDSAGWRERMAELNDAGVSASGINQDDANLKTWRAKYMARVPWNFRIIDTDTGDYYTGPFLTTSLGEAGGHTDVKTYSGNLESSGAITYTEV